MKDIWEQPDEIEITHENLKDIKLENILALTYASDDAMGNPGKLAIIHVDKEFKIYVTNLIHNEDSLLAEKVQKHIEEVLNLEIHTTNDENYKSIDMGFGNILIIYNYYYEEFEKLALKVDKHIFESRGKLYRINKKLLNLQFNEEMEKEKKLFLNSTQSIMAAIIGDIVGSRFEFSPIKSKEFELFIKRGYFDSRGNNTMFTDDTVMTLAVAKSLLECDGDYSDLSNIAIKNMHKMGRLHAYAGYGGNFFSWIFSENPKPYNSFGNGSAMRISATALCTQSSDELNDLVEKVTEITHNHPEGIKGALATAGCIYLAKNKYSKEYIKVWVEKKYYSLDFDYNDILKTYSFSDICQNSVPQSIYAFLISDSYEDAIRTAISMGGDADTMGAITGAIAGAYYGVPKNLIKKAKEYLSDDLLKIVEDFDKKFC